MKVDEPNVLILVLDSARARNMSLYNYYRETTPFLTTLAEDSTTYTQARAPAGRSLPSHASIFTGYLPQEHGLNDLDTELVEGSSVFEWLSERGYSTGLFTDNPYLSDLDIGLGNGFDTVKQSRDLFDGGMSPAAFVEKEGGNYLTFLRHALRSEAPVKSVLNGLSWTMKWRFPQLASERGVFSTGFTHSRQFDDWRESVEDKPWAACMNLMDTHIPFRPMPEFDRWRTEDTRAAIKRYNFDDIDQDEEWKYSLLEDQYDGTIRQADAVVETIVKSLKSSGEFDDTLVILTSDHGEGFGERSPIDNSPTFGHGDAIDEVLLHVPLIVKNPGQSVSKTVNDTVGLVDMPTVVKNAVEGADPDPEFPTDRTVFAGGFENENVTDAAYADDDYGVKRYVRRPEGSWTIHVPTPTSRYILENDIPDDIEATMDSLDSASVTTDTEADVTKSTKEKLQALGYTE